MSRSLVAQPTLTQAERIAWQALTQAARQLREARRDADIARRRQQPKRPSRK